MTVVYKIEMTAQFDDSKADAAEASVIDPKLKSAWERKVEKAFKGFVPDATIICSDIKVFPEV